MPADLLRPFGKLEFIAHNPPSWLRCIRLYAQITDRTGAVATAYEAQPIIYKPISLSPPFTDAEPFMQMDAEAARSLMDELWKCGIRPSEVGTGNELAAVKYHLEDMRTLAGLTSKPQIDTIVEKGKS